MSKMDIKYKILHGEEITPWIDTVAKIRITSFCHAPYYYDGNLSIEIDYLTAYTKDPKSSLTLAFFNNDVCGLLTGMPLVSKQEPVFGATKVFQQHGYDSKEFYYYGEFIVLPNFRHLGIASALYAMQAKYVTEIGFNNECLMTIDEGIDSLQSKESSKNSLWKKLGFNKTDLKIQLVWPTILNDQSIREKEHTLSFWIKKK